MGHKVRYCTTEDGIRIAYCLQGKGPPLLLCPGFVESFSLTEVVPELETFVERLGRGRQLIRFDMRGTGLSQRDVDDLSPNALVEDLAAVVRACELDEFYIWASTISGPRAIQFTAKHADEVAGLILYGTYANVNDVLPPSALRTMAAFIQANPDLAFQAVIGGTNLEHVAAESAIREARVYKESATSDLIARLLLAGEGNDVGPILSIIEVPALVIHRTDDPVVPFRLGQNLASRLPNATLCPLAGSVHQYDYGDTDSIHAAIDAFLPRNPAPEPQVRESGGVRIVLFTDIVGHTEMMKRLGDERGRALLREHERITRETLKAFGGEEVKTMGDGFMASFGSVTKAVECAIALQRAFAGRNDGGSELLRVRVGLNAGEPIEEDGDLFGSTVILASRITTTAGAGEILIPETVRGLLSGKNFTFLERGDFVPKGFHDAVRLYEVRW